MINGLNGGDAEMVFAYFWVSERVRQLGRLVAMETKEQDVSHRGMVTSGCERHCFAI